MLQTNIEAFSFNQKLRNNISMPKINIVMFNVTSDSRILRLLNSI